MAAKKIFPCVARMISLQFHSRKIPSLGGLRTDLRCFSLPLSPPSSLLERYQLSTLSTPSTTANVRLCLVCILPDFPLLGVNGFLFGIVRFGVHQETPLCPSSQRSIQLISASLVPLVAISSGLGHSWQIHPNRSARLVYPCDLVLLLTIAYHSSQRQVHFLAP
jgi:hypothetical protein